MVIALNSDPLASDVFIFEIVGGQSGWLQSIESDYFDWRAERNEWCFGFYVPSLWRSAEDIWGRADSATAN